MPRTWSNNNSHAAVAGFIKFWELHETRGYPYIVEEDWSSKKRSFRLSAFQDDPRFNILSYAESLGEQEILFEYGNSSLCRYYMSSSSAHCKVASGDLAELKEIFKLLKKKFPVLKYEKTTIPVRFAYNTPNGPVSFQRSLEAPSWDEVRDNYTSTVRTEMERLIGDFEPARGGQLLLWQGEPGTGKTYAIRSLIKSWISWCDATYIVDPDQFFEYAHYMMNTLLFEGNRWKLIVVEDAGELIAKDARERTGQALSRLLNISQGFIGQGLRVLILITTNERIVDLHEAISRPGRCASKLEFDKLSTQESNAWLRAHEDTTEVTKDQSLAELFAIKENYFVSKKKVVKKLGL